MTSTSQQAIRQRRRRLLVLQGATGALAVGLLWLLIASIANQTSVEQQARDHSIEALVAFAKTYGYVRFFYPGDDASQVDWERFAIEGTRLMKGANGPADITTRLEELFNPIASRVSFGARPTPLPTGREGMPVKAWQHAGVGVSSAPFYMSLRLNRPERHGGTTMPGILGQEVALAGYGGREFLMRVSFRTEYHGVGGGVIPVLAVQRRDGLQGFTHFPLTQPQRSTEWTEYEFFGQFDDDAESATLEYWVQGAGSAWFAEPELLVRIADDEWEPVSTFSPTLVTNRVAPGGSWTFQAQEHTLHVDTVSVNGYAETLHVSYQSPETLFDNHPAVGEVYRSEIAPGIHVHVPIALPAADIRTEPIGIDSHPVQTPELSHGLDLPDVRLAGVIIAWNVFRHFFPYTDDVDIHWEEVLRRALRDARDSPSTLEYLLALERMLVPLEDGHARVAHRLLDEQVPAPVRFEYIEGQVVVAAAPDTSLLRPGDVVHRINGERIGDVFRRELQQVSGSPRFRFRRALGRLGRGPEGSTVTIEVERGTERHSDELQRGSMPFPSTAHIDPLMEVEPGIYYVDIRRIAMPAITEALSQLAEADGVILDWRGFPQQGTANLLPHLTDRELGWIPICIPKTTRPESPGGEGCLTLGEGGPLSGPASPQIAGTVVVITDERAYSTAESYLDVLRNAGAVHIVGRPTGGANGNQNWLDLPGNIQVYWTGMRIVRIDGERLHAVGLPPDTPVERTIDALLAGRDEDLEVALDLIRRR